MDNAKAVDTLETKRHETFRVDYANSVAVRFWLRDFLLEMGIVAFNAGEFHIEVFEHVFMSPQQAKAMLLDLQRCVVGYERTYGPINLEDKTPAPSDLAESAPASLATQ